MITDLERASVPEGHIFDVCIVGGGAAGIVLSLELARLGRSVVLLEGGGKSFEADSQALYLGESTGLPYEGVYNARCRVLGGTTALWGGQILELDEHVFGGRRGIEGGQWPFDKTELTQHYRRAIALEGLEGSLDEAGLLWQRRDLPVPSLGENLHSAFSRWCPRTNFAHLHGQALRDNPRILVVLHANVCELQLGPDAESIRSVRARTLTGRQAEFSGRAVVLTTGGIETCRLLLQPMANGRVGPWAQSGLVGRHYQDHVKCAVGSLASETMPFERYFDYCYVDGFKYHPKLKLAASAQARLGTLDVCGTIGITTDGVDDLNVAYETYRLWKTRRLRSVSPARLAHFIRNAHKLLWHRIPYLPKPRRRTARSQLRLFVHCEQTPLSSGQVSLTSTRDRLGLLQVRVAWCAGELELHSVRTYLRVICQEFSKRGLGMILPDRGVEQDDALLMSSFRESSHHIGGTRMAKSAADGVVDTDLRLFGVKNGYVCASSVFPSAGFVNPTHTVLALAVRLAEHLGRRIA